ncbi:hypothetical protein evm_006070 [Chilo suppressalis]|nr:hypothetical protein evm_006070 [Chilo suppressalis]
MEHGGVDLMVNYQENPSTSPGMLNKIVHRLQNSFQIRQFAVVRAYLCDSAYKLSAHQIVSDYEKSIAKGSSLSEKFRVIDISSRSALGAIQRKKLVLGCPRPKMRIPIQGVAVREVILNSSANNW